MVFFHLNVVNSFTIIYNILLRINIWQIIICPPRQIWQVLARAPLRVAVGRLRTTPLLHILWPDTFWLGRCLLSPQPSLFPLFPTHPSWTWTRQACLAVAGHRPPYPSSIRVESLSGLRTLPRRNLPLRSSFKLWSPHLHWQVQVCGRCLSSCPESLRSRVFGTSVSSSLSPLIPSRFKHSVESARDGAGRGDAAGVCHAATVAALLGPLA